MKVIIAGSRSILPLRYRRVELERAVFLVECAIKRAGYEITEVVSGTAHGVDRIGESWAEVYGVPIKRFPANWAAFGKRAGPHRNGLMADYADALIAVWDGSSAGTKNMIDHMAARGKPYFPFVYDYIPL